LHFLQAYGLLEAAEWREEALVHGFHRLLSTNRRKAGWQENGVVGDHAGETRDVLGADRGQPILG